MAKQSLSDRVFALLDDERVEVRCAAAVVLGAAGKGDAAVERALARKLGDESPLMRRFALEALEAVGARKLGAELIPLLGSSDEDTRNRALRLLAAQGVAAEQPLARALGEGPPAGRRQAAKLLIELGSAGALDALFDALGEPELGDHVLHLLRTEIDKGEARVVKLVQTRALAGITRVGKAAKLTGKGAKATRSMAEADAARLAILLRVAGYAADPAQARALAEHAQPAWPTVVRMGALAALRRIVAAGSGAGDAVVDALIDHADDADPQVARAAIDTLRGAHVPEKLVKRFRELSHARNPDAQRLAAERLAALAGRSAIPTLIENLLSGDHALREASARSLAGAPEAAGPLARALADVGSSDADAEPARRLVQALRPHAERVPKPAVEHLVERARKRLLDDRDRAEPALLQALTFLAPDAHAEVLFERADKLRRAGRHADAFASLRPLAQAGARLSDEQRFVIGVLGLKTSSSALLRSARGVDPVLMQFAQLVAAGYPVAQKLAKQKDLELGDLFTLGFNFIESDEGTERALGEELLEHVRAQQPRGKLGLAARNKLKLAGASD